MFVLINNQNPIFTMKKIILTAAAVFAFGYSNAQDAKFGVKGGLDLVSFSGGSGSITGFAFGGFAEFSLSDKVSLQPGLNFHTASENGVSINFIGLPVLAKFNVAEKINLLAGPSLYKVLDAESAPIQVNIDLGASYDINENLFIEPRYSITTDGEGGMNHFVIGLGYKF